MFSRVDTRHSGVEFNNRLEPDFELNILSYLYYYNGGGVAAADLNNDGFTDLYFAGNQVADKLYLNKGNFTFEDVTERAQITDDGQWSVGVTHADVNADGLIDIYVCRVGGFKSMNGRNQLYLNQGPDEEGVPKFVESAEEYGLDFSGLSTHAVFFDYDLDSDLDMFLLNHSVYPNRSYGKGSKRNEVDSLSGDRLYRNDNGLFTDVSGEAKIFQGSIGYGLGLSVSDVNADGYPDLYIGNDFFENDYLYINQGDGSFEEIISVNSAQLGHTTHYSMGNSMADLNNDGLTDIVSLDMLPESLETLKTSGNEYPYHIYSYYLRNGYSPQYMQNTLHLNRGSMQFSEVAFQSGIAATEWSWGVLTADFDMDGYRDLYISNGIKGATNDMDFVSFIAQEKIQRGLDDGVDQDELKFIEQLPEKKIPNYAFRNNGAMGFENVSGDWFESFNTFSNGCTFADLDNDGDLDLVVNNINEEASIYKNNSNVSSSGFIKLKFNGSEQNPFGIGAKVEIRAGDLYLLEENYPTSSYLSATSNVRTLGLGGHQLIDSLSVTWPGGAVQVLKNVNTNELLTLDYQNATDREVGVIEKKSLISNTRPLLEFEHREEACLEFEREPLIPFAKSNEGPRVAMADVNGDGLKDIYIGGGKRQPGELFIQNADYSFTSVQKSTFEANAINEDTDQVFTDPDGDGDVDLVVVSGGNEFRNGKPLEPVLYRNDDGIFNQDADAFKGIEINASVVMSFDFDNDGDQDLLIGSNAVPWSFGKTGRNVLLENRNGIFSDVTEEVAPDFAEAGLVEDIAIKDMDGNGFPDIVAVGHWMPVSVFLNNGSAIELQSGLIPQTEGWWNSVVTEDFDQDGDMDIVAGNWGLNTRLSASDSNPITLYRTDFDDNGTIDPVVTYFYNGQETVFASKDELVKQIPNLNKKHLSYESFASADLTELFPGKKLRGAEVKKVYELQSCYFENQGDHTFVKRPLPWMAQISSVHAIFTDDFNGDGFSDLLLAGNSYEISTQLGRLDASHGLLLLNDRKGFFQVDNSQFDIPGPARDIGKIEIENDTYYIVTINAGQPVFIKGFKK